MFNSIRIRLTLWYLGILALIIIAFTFGTYFLVKRNLNQRTNQNLGEVAQSVIGDLHREEADIFAERALQKSEEETGKKQPEPDEDEKTEPKEEIPTIEKAITEEMGDLRFNDYSFLVTGQGGELVGTTINDEGLKTRLIKLSDNAEFFDLQNEAEVLRFHRQWIELDGKRFQFLATRSLREQTQFLTNLRNIFYATVPLALLLAGFAGYFLARRSLAPVVSMSRQADKIGSSNLGERLPVKNEQDELGGLANTFNALLERLQVSFEQQRQFMADASHELRTPLAIVRTESEVAISNSERTAPEYRESLNIVHEESKHLTNIVEDLFLLARADSGQIKPQVEPVDLKNILEESTRSISVLAEKRKIGIEPGELPVMPLRADASLLHRLFLNLLDNAVKYNREGGKVLVSAENLEKGYRISISDTGNGIAMDKQAKIFERFYRVDKARSRNNGELTGGAGLGLSIAAWIAELHNGSLVLKKSDAEGSVFVVELPQ